MQRVSPGEERGILRWKRHTLLAGKGCHQRERYHRWAGKLVDSGLLRHTGFAFRAWPFQAMFSRQERVIR